MIPAVRHEIVGPADSPHRIRIAHLSDFHLWFSSGKLACIEELIAPWKPDVLALTGDYADTTIGRRFAAEWIEKMAAAHPLCWVAGNHDRWGGELFLQKLANIPGAHAIDHRDAWIHGANGCAYRFTSWNRLSQSPRRRPDSTAAEPTLVLLHDPALIQPEKLPPGGKPLLLAGHLHGGQINLWRDRRGRPQPASSWYKGLADRTTVGTATLIVSRGLGDTLPVRLRAPQEIVMIDFGAEHG
jgi:uncharacterized protein